METFTTAEASQITGATARQLQWWDERGIVIPLLKQHARAYSLDDLLLVSVALWLKDSGIGLRAFRKILKANPIPRKSRYMVVFVERPHCIYCSSASDVLRVVSSPTATVTVPVGSLRAALNDPAMHSVPPAALLAR